MSARLNTHIFIVLKHDKLLLRTHSLCQACTGRYNMGLPRYVLAPTLTMHVLSCPLIHERLDSVVVISCIDNYGHICAINNIDSDLWQSDRPWLCQRGERKKWWALIIICCWTHRMERLMTIGAEFKYWHSLRLCVKHGSSPWSLRIRLSASCRSIQWPVSG